MNSSMDSRESEQLIAGCCQGYSDFFAGWTEAPGGPILKRLNHLSEKKCRLSYDFLFRGTDAYIYIPLWASACMDQGDILLDHTTAAVIDTYHSWGYEPLIMDGNPPDYIGEMLRFLAYLSAGILYENTQGRSGRKIIEARADFWYQYVEPTVKTAVEGVNSSQERIYYKPFMEIVLEFLDGIKKLSSLILLTQETVNDQYEEWQYFLERGHQFKQVELHGLNSALSDEPEQLIKTAGINNCGGLCVICPVIKNGCILRVETDSSQGQPQLRACVRGRGYRKTFLSSRRLRYPMKRLGERGGGRFERISWEEAADLIAAEWKRIKDTYGVSSRYVIYSTGVTGVMSPEDLARRLLYLDGGCLGYYNSYSSACASYITPYIYGTADSGNSDFDILNTKLLILWGHNPVETIFSSEMNGYLMELKSRGIKIVVIDPRCSQTAAALADQWIPLYPSTDSALADGMAYVIWSEGLQDQHFMDTYCLGFDEQHMPEGIPGGESYYSYLFGMKDGICRNPEWAEQVTGVSQDIIRELAREYATVKPACLLTGLGLQRTGNGEQSVRSTALLTCLTGNVGVSGGSAAGVGRIREHTAVRLFNQPENPYPGRIPVFQWTKAIEWGVQLDKERDGLEGVPRLESNIKMIINLAGNTLVNQHSDINDTIRIIKDTSKCELILVSDIFMTASALYADILLPGTSVFEGDNLSAPWKGNNYLLKNNQVIKPLFECRFEWEWLKEIAKKLGYYELFVDGCPDMADWLKGVYHKLAQLEPELPDYESFSCEGGYRYQKPIKYIAFHKQIKEPEQYKFDTPSGKIEIFSKKLYQMNRPDEIPAIPCYVPCNEGREDLLRQHYPLQLIGWHTRRRCHSIHDNNEWMDEVEIPSLWIHPDDAAERGISDGDVVEVFNGRGRVRIPAAVTRRIMKGVTAMSQGGWFTPDIHGTDTRGSINVLTTVAAPTPLAKGNPQHTNLVEVSKFCKVL